MTVYALGELRPELAEDVWVAPSATVAGNVRLGAGVSVWFGAVLRGDTEALTLGAGTNFQDGAVGHADPGFPLVIGENVTVGHKAIVHGCTVGDGSLIGMGAIVLNGAVIGRGCLIGAGALVPEGKVIPDGMLVLGAPGRAVKPVSEAQAAGMLRTAEHYRANGRRFREGLAAL